MTFMQATPLHTKLHRPAPTPGVIARPRLLHQINDGLACKVTLVSAGAGFGKSTLLSAWLDQLLEPPHDAINASWLTLDPSDDQLSRFLRGFVAAIEERFPQSCAAVNTLLQENPAPTLETLADVFVNVLESLASRFVLVLDDYHVIEDKAIHAVLARLVQFAPSSFHLVLGTRVDPYHLPLNRWRARGWLTEVRQQDLCFTTVEAAAFLTNVLPRPVSHETVTALHTYTEGWPVGLRLAALAMRGHANSAAYLADIAANRDRYVMDYLRDDVLDQQPEDVQTFLLGTSILKRFCPALCATVLQIEEARAEQLLAYVERANLFLVDLSAPSLWYRYHHQFQSMLQSKLYSSWEPPAIAGLYRRAAVWLAANAGMHEALEYLVEIEDFERAADLLEGQRIALAYHDDTYALMDALALIPEHVLNEHLLLLLSAAWVHHSRMEDAQCAAKVLCAEHLLRQGVQTTRVAMESVQLELVALRCTLQHTHDGAAPLTDIKHAWAHAQPYLAEVPTYIITALAETCQSLGDAACGIDMLTVALERNTQLSLSMRCDLLVMKALMEFWECNFAVATRECEAILQLAQRSGIKSVQALCQLLLGAMALYHHRLDNAELYLQHTASDPNSMNGRYAFLGICCLIDLYAYQGRPRTAGLWVEQFKLNATRVGSRLLREYADGLEAYQAMVRGDIAQAMAWALHNPNDTPGLIRHSVTDRICIIRARILIAGGSSDSLEQACKILNDVRGYMESQHHRHLLVEVCGLLALALAGVGEMELALMELRRSVEVSAACGILGPLIQLGEPMRQLLRALSARTDETSHIKLVLAAFPTPPIQQTNLATEILVEPLTERELDVLRLVADGLSNKEIALRLSISTYTARNHTVNILGKLGVDNRLRAVERARQLKLLLPVG